MDNSLQSIKDELSQPVVRVDQVRHLINVLNRLTQQWNRELSHYQMIGGSPVDLPQLNVRGLKNIEYHTRNVRNQFLYVINQHIQYLEVLYHQQHKAFIERNQFKCAKAFTLRLVH